MYLIKTLRRLYYFITEINIEAVKSFWHPSPKMSENDSLKKQPKQGELVLCQSESATMLIEL